MEGINTTDFYVWMFEDSDLRNRHLPDREIVLNTTEGDYPIDFRPTTFKEFISKVSAIDLEILIDRFREILQLKK